METTPDDADAEAQTEAVLRRLRAAAWALEERVAAAGTLPLPAAAAQRVLPVLARLAAPAVVDTEALAADGGARIMLPPTALGTATLDVVAPGLWADLLLAVRAALAPIYARVEATLEGVWVDRPGQGARTVRRVVDPAPFHTLGSSLLVALPWPFADHGVTVRAPSDDRRRPSDPPVQLRWSLAGTPAKAPPVQYVACRAGGRCELSAVTVGTRLVAVYGVAAVGRLRVPMPLEQASMVIEAVTEEDDLPAPVAREVAARASEWAQAVWAAVTCPALLPDGGALALPAFYAYEEEQLPVAGGPVDLATARSLRFCGADYMLLAGAWAMDVPVRPVRIVHIPGQTPHGRLAVLRLPARDARLMTDHAGAASAASVLQQLGRDPTATAGDWDSAPHTRWIIPLDSGKDAAAAPCQLPTAVPVWPLSPVRWADGTDMVIPQVQVALVLSLAPWPQRRDHWQLPPAPAAGHMRPELEYETGAALAACLTAHTRSAGGLPSNRADHADHRRKIALLLTATLPVLRTVARALGVPTSGSRAVVLDHVLAHVGDVRLDAITDLLAGSGAQAAQTTAPPPRRRRRRT
jgi:hypothetical protein